ncbi:MAG: hypothetical protein INR71_07695, partial [Terriglobus roseus]|nr:hypothetical protein [Terriglobus roseus]
MADHSGFTSRPGSSPSHPSDKASMDDGNIKPSPSAFLLSSPPGTPSRVASREAVTEQSPLLQARDSSDASSLKPVSSLGSDEWNHQQEETKSSWWLFLLTLGGLGLQVGWSVETSNGSPYLLSLGLDKSVLALVWIA